MALVKANLAFDQDDLDFLTMTLLGGYGFLNDAYVDIDGDTYRDLFGVAWQDGGTYNEALLGGTQLNTDASLFLAGAP